MPLANSIARRKTSVVLKTGFSVLLLFVMAQVFAQENSPYSRYGLGTTVPNTNVVNRAMGGISAGYADPLSINFSNPASYSRFQVYTEEKSQKPVSGRVLFDVGINIENRTLREPNVAQKFSGTSAAFSHMQLGVPLRKNWGMSFGLRQLHRISYKVGDQDAIYDAGDGHRIDSGYTEYSGDGGTFMPNIGTGFAIKNLSLGVTMGYLFGRRDYSTTRTLYDTVEFKTALYDADATYGGLFFSGGAQYRMKLNKDSTTILRLGVSGNLNRTFNANRDIIRSASGTGGTDTVYHEKGVSGKVVYPASYTIGFVLERRIGNNGQFLIGTDLVQNKWSSFRFFGAQDSVQDNWQLRVGTQLRPNAKVNSGYFSNVSYRAGFYFGPDYIRVGNELPVFGVSFGMGLPLGNTSALARTQFTVINLGLEYEQRGNNKNTLKENLFRFSIGLNLSDLWFSKRKYD